MTRKFDEMTKKMRCSALDHERCIPNYLTVKKIKSSVSDSKSCNRFKAALE